MRAVTAFREAGYRDYRDRLSWLLREPPHSRAPVRVMVAPGGFLVLCSCSHAVDLLAFRTASIRGIGRGGRSSQILHTGFAGPDHPQLPQLAESGYLKALVFRLDGA